VRAFPLLGERPSLAVADGFDEAIEGFTEIHLTGFDEDEPSRCAGEEHQAGIDEGVHGARPATLRTKLSLKPARFQARSKIK
jgi:hypothetical protein